MQNCEVCGRRFDPLKFQIVVPELSRGFDNIECANRARSQALPARRIGALPLVALVEPIGAPRPAGVLASAVRPLAVPAVAVCLLAAGTAAATLLWARVLSPATTSFPFTRATAPSAFAGETLRAHTRRVPEGIGRPVASTPAEPSAPNSTTAALAAVLPAGDRIAAGMPQPHGTGNGGGDTSKSSRVADSPESRARTALTKTTGKDHVKRGKGHYKHGETNGVHSPNHGRPHGHGKGH